MLRVRLRPALSCALAILCAGGCGDDAPERAEPVAGRSAAPTFAVTYAATGLTAPTAIVGRPGDPGRLYVLEQGGRVRTISPADGALAARPFLDISRRVLSGGERGLLGLAFHPDHARNHKLYVHYSRRPDGDTRVLELRATGSRATLRGARTLLRVDQPYENHKGGQLAFGPDGRLYLGLGDGGSAFDPRQNAQNLRSRLGKVLALDVDDPRAQWQIIAYGLRNPWRFSFDRKTGDAWIADVGQDRLEEVDLLRAGERRMVNFGWSVFEGNVRQRARRLNPAGPLRAPVHVYDHRDGGCSITGGYVYRGRAVPALRGRYVFGDFCRGTLWSLALRDGRATDLRREQPRLPNLTSFGEDLDGELYATTIDGQIHRLVPVRAAAGEATDAAP